MTSSTQRNLTVYIGRFSPFHKGHAEIIERALKLSKYVLVIIGSAKQPRTIKNPWSASERQQMITDWHRDLVNTQRGDDGRLVWNSYEREEPRLMFAHQQDRPYSNQRWLSEVQQHVTEANFASGDVWLTGSDRDASTFYLKEFPSFKLDLVEQNLAVSKSLTATSIRDLYFGSRLTEGRPLGVNEVDSINKVFLPPTAFEFLSKFRETDAYAELVNEYNFQVEHDKRWAVAPYPPIFSTVDAVVVQTGHVLLIKRRYAPGRGLWALPGGYLNPGEWMLDGAIRELKEETKIDLPVPVIRGSLEDDMVFDAPGRSLRGRIVTRAFLFQLPDFVVDGRVVLPKLRGGDDAAKARWFPLSEVAEMSENLFEDHHAIIETMVARLKVKR